MDLVFAKRQSDSAPTCENPTVIKPLLSGVVVTGLLFAGAHAASDNVSKHRANKINFFIIGSSCLFYHFYVPQKSHNILHITCPKRHGIIRFCSFLQVLKVPAPPERF